MDIQLLLTYSAYRQLGSKGFEDPHVSLWNLFSRRPWKRVWEIAICPKDYLLSTKMVLSELELEGACGETSKPNSVMIIGQ